MKGSVNTMVSSSTLSFQFLASFAPCFKNSHKEFPTYPIHPGNFYKKNWLQKIVCLHLHICIKYSMYASCGYVLLVYWVSMIM